MPGFLAVLLAVTLLQDAKPPVPSEEEQRASQKAIQEIFEKEYGETDSEKLAAFAGELLRQGNETSGNSVDRYVLLREASRIAAKAGDLETAFGAADRIGDLYENPEVLQLKEEAFSSIRGRVRTTEEKQRYADFSFRLALEALHADDFGIARASARRAESYARLTRDQGLSARARTLGREIPVYEREYREAEDALVTLFENPDDPAAKTTYGTYLCFIKGNWEKGLRLLSSSGDARLEEVAKIEANASDAGAQARLADLYDQLAGENGNNSLKERNLLARALHWYESSLRNGLQGLDKIRVEKKIEEIGEKTAGMAPGGPARTLTPKPQFVLEQGARLAGERAPQVAKRSIRIEALLKDRADGAILSHGGGKLGYVLYIENDRLNFTLRFNGNVSNVTAPRPLPVSGFTVGSMMTRNGQVTLFVNGRPVATGKAPGSLTKNPNEPLIVGNDTEYAVGNYKNPFEYKGTIHSVRLQYGDD